MSESTRILSTRNPATRLWPISSAAGYDGAQLAAVEFGVRRRRGKTFMPRPLSTTPLRAGRGRTRPASVRAGVISLSRASDAMRRILVERCLRQKWRHKQGVPRGQCVRVELAKPPFLRLCSATTCPRDKAWPSLPSTTGQAELINLALLCRLTR